MREDQEYDKPIYILSLFPLCLDLYGSD